MLYEGIYSSRLPRELSTPTCTLYKADPELAHTVLGVTIHLCSTTHASTLYSIQSNNTPCAWCTRTPVSAISGACFTYKRGFTKKKRFVSGNWVLEPQRSGRVVKTSGRILTLPIIAIGRKAWLTLRDQVLCLTNWQVSSPGMERKGSIELSSAIVIARNYRLRSSSIFWHFFFEQYAVAVGRRWNLRALTSLSIVKQGTGRRRLKQYLPSVESVLNTALQKDAPLHKHVLTVY